MKNPLNDTKKRAQNHSTQRICLAGTKMAHLDIPDMRGRSFEERRQEESKGQELHVCLQTRFCECAVRLIFCDCFFCQSAGTEERAPSCKATLLRRLCRSILFLSAGCLEAPNWLEVDDNTLPKNSPCSHLLLKMRKDPQMAPCSLQEMFPFCATNLGSLRLVDCCLLSVVLSRRTL